MQCVETIGVERKIEMSWLSEIWRKKRPTIRELLVEEFCDIARETLHEKGADPVFVAMVISTIRQRLLKL